MGIVYTPESEYAKELAKWNTPRSQGGMRPDHPEMYPAMLYKANKRPDGKYTVIEVDDRFFSGHPGSAEAWSRANYITVRDESEERRKLNEGWRKSPGEAMEYAERFEREMARAAAERAYADRNMSDAAKSEAAQAEAATMEHVPEVPTKRGPGRPRKERPADS